MHYRHLIYGRSIDYCLEMSLVMRFMPLISLPCFATRLAAFLELPLMAGACFQAEVDDGKIWHYRGAH